MQGMRNDMNWYTLYRAEDDEILAIGRNYECAARMGIKQSEFPHFIWGIKNGKNRKYIVVIEDIESVEEDELSNGIVVYGEGNQEYQKTYTRKLDTEKAMDLYYQGLNDREIAKKCRVEKSSIYIWRKKNNLPPRAKRGYQHKEVV